MNKLTRDSPANSNSTSVPSVSVQVESMSFDEFKIFSTKSIAALTKEVENIKSQLHQANIGSPLMKRLADSFGRIEDVRRSYTDRAGESEEDDEMQTEEGPL